MWQKAGRKYHFILNGSEILPDGRYAKTACDDILQIDHKKQNGYPMDGKCSICAGVTRLINGSVDDARYFLKSEKRPRVLQLALELTTSVTLTKMLEAKIRKLSLTLPSPAGRGEEAGE